MGSSARDPWQIQYRCGSEGGDGGTLALRRYAEIGKATSSIVVFGRKLALGSHLKVRGR